MNKRDKLNQIKYAMRQSTPDVIKHIDLSQIQNLGPTIDPNLFLATKPFPFRVSYKKLAFLCSMVIVLIVGIIYIGNGFPMNSEQPGNELYENQLKSSEEVPFAYAVLTGGSIMQHFITEINADQLNYQSYNPNIWLIEERLETLNRYIPFIKGILEDDVTSSMVVTTSPREDYAFQMTYQVVLLDQSVVVQTVYYNLTTVDSLRTMEGMIENNQQTLYFEVRFEAQDTTIYRFYSSLTDVAYYIELRQIVQTSQTSYQLIKHYPDISTPEAMIIVKENGVELILLKSDKIDTVFQVSKEEHLVVSYQIGTQTESASSDSLFPSLGDYQFESRSLYEIGTITISFEPDPFSGIDRVNYSIIRPMHGLRVYLYDID